MCSIGEDDFGDEGGLHSMIKDEEISNSNTNMGKCTKCGIQRPIVKLKFREAECTNCFLVYVRHKFRATLGSSKILPRGAQVLLLFDGSAESLVLLDMMNYAQTQNTYKRLHVVTKILFINESFSIGATNIQEIELFLSKYKFETFVISLADKNSLRKLEKVDLYFNSNCEGNSFMESMRSIESETARQDFLKVWKSSLIEIAANQLKCDYVFLPDISTNLAADLLTSISLGRGGSAALYVSLLDDRFPGLKIIRPLRTLNAEEVNLYLKVNCLESFKLESYGEVLGARAKPSIQNLTKNFVENLQENFSSTVSTVFRTGDKLANHTPKDLCPTNVIKTCQFCKSNFNYASCNTLRAIEFSRLASALSGNIENWEKQVTASEKLLANGGPVKLCHACANIKKYSGNFNLI